MKGEGTEKEEVKVLTMYDMILGRSSAEMDISKALVGKYRLYVQNPSTHAAAAITRIEKYSPSFRLLGGKVEW